MVDQVRLAQLRAKFNKRTLAERMDLPCIEPVKRRHGSYIPVHQSHRYPIKGGIALKSVWTMEMMESLSRQSWFSKHFQP